MKAFGITALIGALLAIPFILVRCKSEVARVNGNDRLQDTNLRYDIDDFIT